MVEAAPIEVLAITGQPESVTAVLGDTVTFTVTATGAVSYQWQYKSGSKWYNSPAEGNDTDTLTVEATVARDGMRYRCIVTGADGTTVTSAVVTLTLAGVTAPEQIESSVLYSVTVVTGIEDFGTRTAVIRAIYVVK